MFWRGRPNSKNLKYFLSFEADRDIDDILLYTKKTWGYAQFRKYEKLLLKTFSEIGENPQLLTSRSHSRIYRGLRSCMCGKHRVFYIPFGDKVEIVRVLHQAMDFMAHLK